MSKLTHLDDSGAAHMVDVSAKATTVREAKASGQISMLPEAITAIRDGTAKKGDVLAVARVAGIMAAKRTSELIPLCHPVTLSSVSIDFDVMASAITVTVTARSSGQTGVEMEALTAVSATLLTLYDMVKALDKAMIISDIKLLTKSGGKSGDWHRAP
jgi:cyclic pyranopterin monophosphate synthase